MTSRRSALAAAARTAGLAGVGALAALGLAGDGPRALWARTGLTSQAVAFDGAAQPSGSVSRRTIREGELSALVPRTRVLSSAPDADALAAATDSFLTRTRLTPGPLGEEELLISLDESALLDVHSLTWGLPSPVAAWTPHWRYTWPRDAAHVIVALHERGETAWALELLRGLAGLIREDGFFEARYVPGAARVPDARPMQLDGTGWFLWAASSVQADAPDAAVARAVTLATEALLRITENPHRLPPPSPDYWEVRERRLTLATAAMTAAGLHASAAAGVAEAAVLTRAKEVTEAVLSEFGRRGFQRYTSGGGPDAGVLMLLPPYLPEQVVAANPHLRSAVMNAYAAMQRPAGGVAPGAGWKRDGISWTPQTAMFAQAYAHLGEEREAREVLRWLAHHRTAAGALPEKVLATGEPAAVAPLAWTGSLVLSALHKLTGSADTPSADQ